MNQLKQIQSQMFLLGLHQDRFTLSKLIAFCTDPSLGNLNYTEKVVHYIQNPWKDVWNWAKVRTHACLVDLLGRAGLLDEAEEMIERVPSENNEIMIPL